MVIVDTYNLLHAALGPAGGGRDFGVAGLARLILQSRYRRRPVRLVCDGRRGPDDRVEAPLGAVEIVYAGPGKEADAVIERFIRDSNAPRRLTVVSSDRRIVRAARKRRAETLASERFLAHLLTDSARGTAGAESNPHREEVPLGSASVEAWMAYFGRGGAVPAAESWAPASKAPAEMPKPGKAARAPEPELERDSIASDPLLREAVEHFGGRVAWDELDMSRWLAARANGKKRSVDERMDAPDMGL